MDDTTAASVCRRTRAPCMCKLPVQPCLCSRACAALPVQLCLCSRACAAVPVHPCRCSCVCAAMAALPCRCSRVFAAVPLPAFGTGFFCCFCGVCCCRCGRQLSPPLLCLSGGYDLCEHSHKHACMSTCVRTGIKPRARAPCVPACVDSRVLKHVCVRAPQW